MKLKIFLSTALIFVFLFLFLPKTMSFEPFNEEEKNLFRFDLKKNFYQSDKDFESDVKKAKEIIKKIEEHKEKVGSSAKELYELFSLISDYTDIYYKLYAYGEFREAINTKDRKAYETYLEVSSEADSKIAFVKVELKNLTREKFQEYLKELPELAKYEFVINDTLRKSPYWLSQEKEEILSKLAPTRFEWQGVLFQLMFDRTKFEEIEAQGKKFDVGRDFEGLLRNPERPIREKAFKSYFSTLGSISDVCGFALYNLMKSLNEEANLRGFSTYYEETLFDSYLTKSEMENIFGQIKENANIYKDYQKYKLENAKKRENLSSPQIWDIEIPPTDAEEPRFTASEATEIVKKALSSLGPKYLEELSALLDPKNGRLDIVGGPNRRQGAFCEAGFGFFQDNYQGYLSDISTLAHESGHAIHHRLVLLNRKGEMFSQCPPYLTESFSMLNEYLLRDYLLKTLKTEKERKAIIYDQLNEEMYLWELARRAEFEMASYDKVAKGEVKDAEGFNNVCFEVGKNYDIFFDTNPELKLLWMRKHHYWTVPAYYKNYVVAQILAMKYFELYKKDPQGFAKNYVAMVEAGMDREPQKLLKDFLGIDLNDKNLLKNTLQMVKEHFEKIKKM
ncbi:MAG: M3 family oligoendopeptidase [Thermoanaerobaculaceae bacterium]|nr:M3 family oligoendopeptidase [Thermoanaerobaculaceae bacterium]